MYVLQSLAGCVVETSCLAEKNEGYTIQGSRFILLFTVLTNKRHH